MIDPYNITNFNRTKTELEAFFLFAVICSGKNSDWAAEVVNLMMRDYGCRNTTPFQEFANLELAEIQGCLEYYKTGNYMKNGRAFRGASKLCLETCTIDDLEALYGIGPKTARFFVLHSRPDVRCVPLDVHILAWMRDVVGIPNVPKQTPSQPQYSKWEKCALNLFDNFFNSGTIADIDLKIWSMMRDKDHLDY